MRVKFKFFHWYGGMDEEFEEEFPEGTTDAELYDIAWEYALNNASAYGIYPYPGEDGDLDFDLDVEEDDGQYSDNIQGYWEII